MASENVYLAWDVIEETVFSFKLPYQKQKKKSRRKRTAHVVSWRIASTKISVFGNKKKE